MNGRLPRCPEAAAVLVWTLKQISTAVSVYVYVPLWKVVRFFFTAGLLPFSWNFTVLLYRLKGADIAFYHGRRICNISYLTNSKYDFFLFGNEKESKWSLLRRPPFVPLSWVQDRFGFYQFARDVISWLGKEKQTDRYGIWAGFPRKSAKCKRYDSQRCSCSSSDSRSHTKHQG